MSLWRHRSPIDPRSGTGHAFLAPGPRRLTVALAFGLLGLCASASAATYVPDALLITTDFSSKIRVIDPAKRTIVYDYAPKQEALEGCNQPGFNCNILGMHYLNQGGEDYMDMALYVSDSNDGTSEVDKGYTVIQRIRPTVPATQVWRLRMLDFSDVPDGSYYCSQDPADPFGSIPEVGCELQMVHELNIIREDPAAKTVTMILADLFNYRVLQVTLDYNNGNSGGHVDWVLGDTNPDWPTPAWPNGVQYIADQPGGPYLLVTYYQATDLQNGGGMIQMFQWNGDGWRSAWRFPEDRDGVVARLNTPHMGEFLIDPSTGKKWFGINHSRGASDAWRSYVDYGGSYTMLLPGATLADKPTYLVDGVIHANTTRESSFSRDIDFLDDGTMLLIDAGAESVSTSRNPARVFRVKPFAQGIQPTGKAGYYSTDHAQQNMLAVPDSSVIAEYSCDYGSLFEAEWLPAAKFGKTLKAAAGTTAIACPKGR